MNIIAIDPSIVGTAMVVNGKLFTYVKKVNAWNKKQTKLNKWFSLCEPFMNYRFPEFDYPSDYSEQEIYKLLKFQDIIECIIEDIKSNIDDSQPIHVIIEGYSYSSNAGPLIDLVNFSTQLRLKLLEFVTELTVISPSQGKLESAKITYEATNIGKRVEKWVYMNNSGVKGGSFSKHDMLIAILDNKNIDMEWKDFLNDCKDDIMSMKTIPKPIEDINDAILFYFILKNKLISS